MNIHWSAPCLKYGLGVVFGLGLIGIAPLPGMAQIPPDDQITPDDTLGDERSQINRDVQVRGGNADRIEGGATRGANLFHSFEEFNVNEGQRVYFANPAGIANILSRVTGRDVSDIMGTLGVDGGANLFLLNPNGIIFGPNARLDISGSFFSSTANGFTFPDGTEFSATNPGDSSLLSVSVPLGVQYGPNAPGAISNAGTLSVGQNFRLSGGSITSTGQLFAPFGQLLVEGVAGDVQVRSAGAQTATFSASNNLFLQESQLQTAGDLNLFAGNTVQVRDSVANPFVAYAGGNLTVQGNQNIDIFALNHPSSGLVSGGDMVLRSANTVGGDAHYWTGGNFRIEQLDGNPGNLYSPYDPLVFAFGDVSLADYTGASLHILAGGRVTLRSVNINSTEGNLANTISPSNPITTRFSNVVLSDGTGLQINGSAQPTLDVRAGINWGNIPGGFPAPTTDGVVQPPGGIIPSPVFQSPPTGSDITIDSINFCSGRSCVNDGQVLLSNQYFADSSLNAGSITVQGTTFIPVGSVPENPNDPLDPDPSRLTSISAPGSSVIIDSRGDITTARGIDTSRNSGIGGDIRLLSGGIINTRGGELRSASDNTNGGNITLAANGDIFTDDVGSFVGRNGTGNAGDITLTSDTGSISFGNINADSVNSDVSREDSEIKIEAPRGSVILDDATVSTSNSGSAYAGDIYINAENEIRVVNDSTISSEGNFGRIFIGESSDEGNSISPPERVVINNSQLITTNTNPSTLAGDIFINARDGIRIVNGSAIESNGRFGNIFIGESSDEGNPISPPERVVINNNSRVSAQNTNLREQAAEKRNSGDIYIRATDRITLTNSFILSNTSRRGDSGSITIDAGNNLLNINGSLVINGSFVNSQVLRGGNGDGGDITITAGSFSLSNRSQINSFINDQDNGVNNQDNDTNFPGPIGAGGNITITVHSDITINGASSNGTSNGNLVPDYGGSPSSNDTNPTGIFATLGNGAVYSSGEGDARGSGGNISITAGSLSIIGTDDLPDGQGGNAGIAAKTFGDGDAGNIMIDVDDLSITDGGFLDNSTARRVANGRIVNRDGDAGNITVTADSITLTNENSDRRAIQTSSFLDYRDRGELAPNGFLGIEASAGEINISTDRLRLDGSSLDASTGSSLDASTRRSDEDNIGNIRIQARNPEQESFLILMQGGSQISAQAFGNAVGGNVFINDNTVFDENNNVDVDIENTIQPTGFVVANQENNDIVASAEENNGGNIRINAYAIFGLEERNPRTDFTSDINASSEVGIDGEIVLTTLGIDPTRGLGELETEIINAADLVAEGCVGSNRRGDETQGEFIRSGRGGLSPDPTDTLTDDSLIDPSTPADAPEPASAVPSDPAETASQPIIEAQGLARNASGKVELVPGSANSPVTSPGFAPNTCDAP